MSHVECHDRIWNRYYIVAEERGKQYTFVDLRSINDIQLTFLFWPCDWNMGQENGIHKMKQATYIQL